MFVIIHGETMWVIEWWIGVYRKRCDQTVIRTILDVEQFHYFGYNKLFSDESLVNFFTNSVTKNLTNMFLFRQRP